MIFLTPEESFILNALKSGEDAKSARAPDGVDYQKVSDVASRHGLKPLLRAKTKNISRLPGFYVKDLEDAYRKNLARNVFLWSRLKEVVSAFKSANVDVISFKGPLLAEEFYGDLGLRPMVDLDLLVHRRDVEEAGEILGKLGYAVPSEYDEGFSLKHRSHIPYESSGRVRHSVELHWALTQKMRFGVDAEDVWTGTELRTIDGLSVKVMSYERLLSYLCVHYTHHLHYTEDEFRPKLMWLYDIHLLLEKRGLDWDIILEDAIRERTKTALYCTLSLTKNFFHSGVPPRVLDRLRPGFLRLRLLRFLLNDSSFSFRRYPKSKLACTLSSELLIDRVADRVSFTVKFLLREVEYLTRRL